jgi:hypothetical protein
MSQIYTHNLKILLVDNNGNIVEDQIQLHQIKNMFCEPQTHIMEYNGKRENITIGWNRKKLDNIQTHFMGDLFASPIYDKDSIILKHTQNTIDSIISNYKIKFYISRFIGDRQSIPDFIGIV